MIIKKLYHGSNYEFKSFELGHKIKKSIDRLNGEIQRLNDLGYSCDDIENQYDSIYHNDLWKAMDFIKWDLDICSFYETHPLGIYQNIKSIEKNIKNSRFSKAFFFTDDFEYASSYGNFIYEVDLDVNEIKELNEIHHETIILNQDKNIDCFHGIERGHKVKSWVVFNPDKIIIKNLKDINFDD